MVAMPSQRAGTGREVLPDVREALPDVREWSVLSIVEPGVVGRPSRRAESGREAHSAGREWSGGPP